MLVSVRCRSTVLQWFLLFNSSHEGHRWSDASCEAHNIESLTSVFGKFSSFLWHTALSSNRFSGLCRMEAVNGGDFALAFVTTAGMKAVLQIVEAPYQKINLKPLQLYMTCSHTLRFQKNLSD